MPREVGHIPDDRRGVRPLLGIETVRVGLLDEIALNLALDLELVDLALGNLRDEDLPESGAATASERMAAAVPVIEIADHAHALGVGCPDGEVYPRNSLMFAKVGTEPLKVAVVGPLTQEMQVKVRKDRGRTDTGR